MGSLCYCGQQQFGCNTGIDEFYFRIDEKEALIIWAAAKENWAAAL